MRDKLYFWGYGGRKLREERIRKGLSQRQLAAQLGISNKHVSGLELGTRGVSVNLASRIEKLIGIPAVAWANGASTEELHDGTHCEAR